MTKLNKIFFAVQLYVIIISFCFVDYVFGRTVVTGNKMEINNESKTVVFTGNIKVSNDYNTIVANNIIYDENNYVILAYNGINFLSKFKYDKTIECNGKIACYNENKKSIAIFGDVVLKLNYFINNLYLHIVLYADDIYIDYGKKTLRTFIDVNNFDVMNYCNKSYYFNDVLLKKFLYDGALKKYNRKKIVASICGDKRKCICEANKITFCYSGDDNKIFIEGSVILTFTE